MSRSGRRWGIAACCATMVVTGCTIGGDDQSSPSQVSSSLAPSDLPEQEGWRAENAEFAVTYRLDAAVAASDRVELEIPTGMVFRQDVKGEGIEVAAGQKIGRVMVDPVNEASLSDEDGTVAASRLALLKERQADLHAPVSGVADLDDTGGSIARPGLDVVAALSPLQTLRYEGMAFDGMADVETVVGQRQVTCDAIWLSPTDDGEGAGSSVHCRLPDNVETVAGIPAVLTLSSPAMSDVVAVPYLYVGLDDEGKNYVVHVVENGNAAERPVVVGVTDGVRRVIRSGVKPGDELKAVPQ